MNNDGVGKLADALKVIKQALASVPLSELPALIGFAEEIKAAAWTRIHAGPQNAHGERPDLAPLLTAAQVAEMLNTRKSFIYEAAREKRLKSVHLGKKYVRFTEKAVRDFANGGG